VHTPAGLDTGDKAVAEAFGDALADFQAAHLPYDAPLGSLQYVVRDGVRIPLPGGPGDPDGEFNAIYQNALTRPGTDPSEGSSFIEAVTWAKGDACPVARTVLTYSESDDPDSPHYADQTRLFSGKGWADAAFCAGDVAAQAVSRSTVSGG
jgi:acyl-homoserine-lactone acylase